MSALSFSTDLLKRQMDATDFYQQKGHVLMLAEAILKDELRKESCCGRTFLDHQELSCLKVVVSKIHNLIYGFLQVLPSELSREMLQPLSTAELSNFSKVCRKAHDIASVLLNKRLLNRACKFGYEGNDFFEARQYLKEIEHEVLSIFNIPDKLFTFESGRLDLFRTLEKFKSLASKEMIFHLFNICASCHIDMKSFPPKISRYLLKLTQEGVLLNTSDQNTRHLASFVMLSAALRQSWNVVELALLHGADVDFTWRDPHILPLSLNCSEKEWKTYKKLRPLQVGDSALFYAIEAKTLEGIELLLRYGAGKKKPWNITRLNP